MHPKDFKLLAFTFDDGPVASEANGNSYEEKLIDLFKENNGKATFFYVGKTLEKKGSALPKYTLSQGFEIANHSYQHIFLANYENNLSLLDKNFLDKEVNYTTKLAKQMLRYDMKFYRPAGYGTNDKMFEILKTANMPAIYTVTASLGIHDYSGGSSSADEVESKLRNFLVGGTAAGSIIGLHYSNGVSYNALKNLLPLLYSVGYRFCTVSELFELSGVAYDDIPKNCLISGVVNNGYGTATVYTRTGMLEVKAAKQ